MRPFPFIFYLNLHFFTTTYSDHSSSHFQERGDLMKRPAFYALIVCCGLFLIACGKHPIAPSEKANAGLNIWAHVGKPPALAKTTATMWDSLVVRISSTSSASAMDTILRTFKFGVSDAFINCTLGAVPAGKGRLVEVWTKNNKNLVIHGAPGKKVDLASGEIKAMDFALLPKCGSIYVNIANVPVAVGSDTMNLVYAVFAFGSRAFSDSVARAKNVFLTIDDVPDSASGTLSIVGVGKSDDTLYRYSQPLTFYATRDTAFSAKLIGVSTGISMQISASPPAGTIVSASMDPQKAIDREKGPCVITEIMYAANDSEYVEIYNTLSHDTTFDTLILDIDGAYRYFASVQCKAKGFFVFGRKNLPWVDATHTVSSALDLLTGGGNTVVLRAKDSCAMDMVSFEGGTNNQEWPNFSSVKKSIVLDSLVSDPTYNNFGKNWLCAQTPINQVDASYSSPITAQCGTPGYGGR
jgi:hypothetical protein